MKNNTDYYKMSRPEVASFVPLNIKTILDIGCGQGSFLKLIKKNIGAETWGLEMVPDVAQEAMKNADNVIVGKVEDSLQKLPVGYFDCIVLNDVIEHLYEPESLLKSLNMYLSVNGVIVTSIPNIRHIVNLKNLLWHKDWKYEDAGILDRTHIRFFTRKSMLNFFSNCGYVVEQNVGINKFSGLKFMLLNFLTFGFLSDTAYLQFVSVLRKR